MPDPSLPEPLRNTAEDAGHEASPVDRGPDRRALAEQVLNVRFPMSRSGARLNVDDVDDLLDRAAAQLARGDSVQALVQGRPLRQEAVRPGYAAEPVHLFMQMLVQFDAGGGETAHLPAAPGPVVPPAAGGTGSGRMLQVLGLLGLLGVVLFVVWLILS